MLSEIIAPKAGSVPEHKQVPPDDARLLDKEEWNPSFTPLTSSPLYNTVSPKLLKYVYLVLSPLQQA